MLLDDFPLRSHVVVGDSSLILDFVIAALGFGSHDLYIEFQTLYLDCL